MKPSTKPNLALGIVARISDQIKAGDFKPGDKLPAESAIMRGFGVSRTVVREALSKLQTAGLVETHHGVGTFVLEARANNNFRIDPQHVATELDILSVIELRIGLETEGASLAAIRREPAHVKAMRKALDEFEANVRVAGDTVMPDFRFHLLIAQATGNRYFADIMGHLGTTVIPRTRIASSKLAVDDLAKYLNRVNQEHEEIYDAIARQDADAARAAMRIHLANSQVRIRAAQVAGKSSGTKSK